MSEYDWHPVVLLRWSAEGKLQQHWKRRVSSSRGIWHDEFEWRDVPTQETPVKYPNTGHGHVWPRPDGVKARCGGPGMCTQCSHDQANFDASQRRAKL